MAKTSKPKHKLIAQCATSTLEILLCGHAPTVTF